MAQFDCDLHLASIPRRDTGTRGMSDHNHDKDDDNNGSGREIDVLISRMAGEIFLRMQRKFLIRPGRQLHSVAHQDLIF
jgi:hypothetical protein